MKKIKYNIIAILISVIAIIIGSSVQIFLYKQYEIFSSISSKIEDTSNIKELIDSGEIFVCNKKYIIEKGQFDIVNSYVIDEKHGLIFDLKNCSFLDFALYTSKEINRNAVGFLLALVIFSVIYPWLFTFVIYYIDDFIIDKSIFVPKFFYKDVETTLETLFALSLMNFVLVPFWLFLSIKILVFIKEIIFSIPLIEKE